MAITFLNADLDIYSNLCLTPIEEEFSKYGDLFFSLYCGEDSPGKFSARYETSPEDFDNSERDNSTAEEKIETFCNAIINFGPEAKQLWENANKRVIDLGYRSDNHCKSFNDLISVKALSQMSTLNIELAITIYPLEIGNKADNNDEGETGGSSYIIRPA